MRRRMNCSIYSAFFCESDLLRSLSRGCVPSAFFLGVLMVALLELSSCWSQDHSCGLLGLWPLSCQRLKCCPFCYLLDAGPVLVCNLGAGPQSELLLPLLNVERRDTICWRAPEVSIYCSSSTVEGPPWKGV